MVLGTGTLFSSAQVLAQWPAIHPEQAMPDRLGDLYGEANFGSLGINWKAGDVELVLHDASGAAVQRLLRNLSY